MPLISPVTVVALRTEAGAVRVGGLMAAIAILGNFIFIVTAAMT